MNEFSISNIKKANMYLMKVNAEKIESKPTSTEFSVNRSDKYNIIEMDKTTVSLKLISTIFLEPESLFHIKFEYKADFEFSHKITKKFIDKNINEMLQPIGSEISYLTSTLTKIMEDNYFVMPPIISIDED